MITTPRWHAECHLMANVFQQFEPFVDGEAFGFRGRLFGGKRLTGRHVYDVEIRTPKASYPAVTP